MSFATADLCDLYDGRIQVCEPGLRDFGGRIRFCGVITTVKCFEDNSLVRSVLAEPGTGKVLVVDAGGSRRCAMLGDQLAALAHGNGWSGVILNGCVRDSARLAATELGVKALDTHPRKSHKRGEGQYNLPVTFAGVTFVPGQQVYCDGDGVLVTEGPLA
jgi:regulator of ribonuclease activity A